MNVLLCFGEFELAGNHSHHKGSATCTLPEDVKGPRRENTQLGGKAQDSGSPVLGVGIAGARLRLSDWSRYSIKPVETRLCPDIPTEEAVYNASCLVTPVDMSGNNRLNKLGRSWPILSTVWLGRVFGALKPMGSQAPAQCSK